jgi:molecular chaperone GrpE
MLDFIKIYDDFLRAKEVLSESKINADGLNSILKNMESLMKKYNVTPIEALGEIFDPNFHEAISIISDLNLDDNTITKEIRKGYISHESIIRPTLVEISKKEDNDKND